MSTPPANFGRAFDLSSLGKPKESATKNAINAVTVENLMSDYVQVSKEKPVILLAYAERAAQTVAIRDVFAKLAEADNGTWKFGAIEVESQTQLVQALRIQTLPAAVVFINEQVLPLPEVPAQEDQIRVLLAQIFKLASER
ncbi:MAG: hypothetical protein RL255_244, partial [Actinomycetota bacterium]